MQNRFIGRNEIRKLRLIEGNNMNDLNKDLNRDNTTPVNETGSVRLYKNNNYVFYLCKFLVKRY